MISKEKLFLVIYWSIFGSIAFLFPLIYFLFKLGFFNQINNQYYVSVPVDIKEITLEKSSLCGFSIRGSIDYFCIRSQYQYEYKGKKYLGNKTTDGIFLFERIKAENIKNSLLKKSIVHVDSHNPKNALLINRKEYLDYQPYDISSFWFNPLFVIIFSALGVFPLFNRLFSKKHKFSQLVDIRKESHKTIMQYAGIAVRGLAFWIDIIVFITTLIVIVTFWGIYTLSIQYNNLFIMNFYLIMGLPLIILFSWFTTSKTIGLYLNNMTIVDANSLGKPSFWQFIIRFFGNLFILLTIGVPLLLAAFNKKKQTIADRLSNTVVIQNVLAYPFISTHRIVDESKTKTN